MHFWDKHKTITSYYELLSGEVCDQYGLTQMEYDILMFLHDNPQYNTAAEIVKIRKSAKSHVSTSLKKLENKGLVERIQSKDNKKHIEIIEKYVERKITDVEITYITIHICVAMERKKNQEIAFHVVVVCSGGIGTSQLLLAKLKSHYNFQIVDIISSHDEKIFWKVMQT